MRPIAIFFHTLFFRDTEFLPSALAITCQQVQALESSGLASTAKEIHVGINGGEESRPFETMLPHRAQTYYHGLESKAENLTIVALENWVKTHPGWNILYIHCKGGTHALGESYGETVSKPWRETMMRYLVGGWSQCVADLEAGSDIACCHWLWGMCDGTQNIPAGNFLWLTSDYARRLPSIFLRDRIKTSGIADKESRYEAEVYWGFGSPKPNVKQYLPNGGEGVP
jgi:hypothetical protein